MCDNLAEACHAIETCPNRRPGTVNVEALKAFISTTIQEAVSGWDHDGKLSKYRDQSNFVRWGSVEKDIHARIDDLLSTRVTTARALVEAMENNIKGNLDTPEKRISESIIAWCKRELAKKGGEG